MGGGDYFPESNVAGGSPASRESLAELWQGFLEQESGAASSSAATGGGGGGKEGKGRTGSVVEGELK